MPRCKSCGATDSTTEWGRYARNGRLKVLCPACDGEYQTRRQRTEAAKAEGYRYWGNTPEYKRMQREAEARTLGREIPPYVPQSERNFRGRLRKVERLADRIRARWAAAWLSPFQISRGELYRQDAEFREQERASWRDRYQRRRESEVSRTRAYKLAHPDRVMTHHQTRRERIDKSSDGTATDQTIARLKRQSTHCAYCGEILTRKQTDHMIPLVLGGEHSMRNIAIVCPDCNARKARLSYPEWIERVAPEHRARVVALYQARYRAEAA
jgi:5-methylcytosine-specific restriction endonuclease McrA